jgi:predicted glycoside hydrolase/deacetylase ChbG (UPF0249 family)
VNEVEAQFDAFAATRLPLSHVDGHQHLHAHPAVLPTVIRLALERGAHGIRVPRDPLWPNLRIDRSRIAYKIIVALGHAYLARVCRRLLAGTSLARCDLSLGSLMSGRMDVDYVTAVLGRVRCKSVEVYFHPSEDPDGRCHYGPNRGDLDALLDPRLKRFIDERGFELTTYAGLRRTEPEAASERA